MIVTPTQVFRIMVDRGTFLTRCSICICTLLFLVSGNAHATSFMYLSMGELIEKSDRILTGTVVSKGKDVYISIRETLKGKPTATNEIQTRRWVKTMDLLKPGTKGIFFLQNTKDDNIAVPYHPGCLQSIEKLGHVKSLTDMLKDPKPYVDLSKYPEDPARVYLLGSLFAGFTSVCKEFPFLDGAVCGRQYYVRVPWNDKSRVVVRGKVAKWDRVVLTVTSTNPGGELEEFAQRTVGKIVRFSKANRVHGPFTLTIDARWPKAVGTLKTSDAVAYIRSRLESRNPKVVKEAIVALAKMRDLGALKKIETLLKYEDINVRGSAKHWIVWAKGGVTGRGPAENPLPERPSSASSNPANPKGTRLSNRGPISRPPKQQRHQQERTGILFASRRDGNLEVYVMNADGSGQIRLTNSPGTDNVAEFSPDGRTIVFQSSRDRNGEIYIMNSDGSNQNRLTRHPSSDTSPTFSPNGKIIAFSSDREGSYDIYIMTVDGVLQGRLIHSPSIDLVSEYSPDGKDLLFQSDRTGNSEICLFNLETGKTIQLTSSKNPKFTARFSPDGKKIIYASLEGASRILYMMNRDGSGRRRLTSKTGFNETPVFSPDGKKLIFESRRNRYSRIHIMNVTGKDHRPLIDNKAAEFPSDWR